MGNSGSTHNLVHLDGPLQNGPWMDPVGYRDNRDPYHQLIKVLPDVGNEARLRPTQNGNILHGGGTISGRREPPPFGVYRSNSIHQLHRSQTQLNLREPQQLLRRQSSEINFKRSGSEPDLRHRERELNSMPAPERPEPKSTSHRAKIMRGKKKKAAPPPPVMQHQHQHQHQQQQMNVPLVTKDYDPARFGWKSTAHVQKPPTPPAKETKKLRLFKTKAESRQRPPSLLPSESSDRSALSGRSGQSAKAAANQPPSHVNSKMPKEPTNKWQEAKNKFFPQFRREKSFDISLLKANQQRVQQRVVDVMLHQPSTPSSMKKHAMDDRPVRYSAIETKLRSKRLPQYQAPSQQIIDYERRGYGSAEDDRSRKSDFERELETATKRRSANLDLKPKSKEILNESTSSRTPPSTATRPIPRARTSSESAPERTKVRKEATSSQMNKSDASAKSKSPNGADSNAVVAQPKSTAEKHPPPPEPATPKMEERNGSDTKDDPKIVGEHTKTFYFGMIEGYDDKINHLSAKDERDFSSIHVDAVDKFAESLHQKLKLSSRKNNSDSSGSVLSSVAFDDEYTVRLNDDTNRYDGASDDDGSNIQVHLRPTLPRRQYDIPRFSPSAAWRTLEISLDSPKTDGRPSTHAAVRGDDRTQVSSPELPRRQLEERIQRVYREPIPGFSDNKSGDSGISGDAGLADRPDSSSRQLQNNADDEPVSKVGPFLTPWTPQQDLNDDSSSDGAVDVNGTIGSKEESTKLSNCGHIFSLSLPRESHFVAYSGPLNEPYYAPKHTFNSLQKTKPSLAQVFGGMEDSGVPYENKLSIFHDNWLLSRSAPNSIDNFNLSIAKSVDDETNNYNIDSKQPARPNTANELMTSLQMDIQPASFNFITSGKHMMYLPKNAVNSINNDTDHSSSNATTTDDDLPEHIKKTLERKYSPKVDSTSPSRKNDHKNDELEDSNDCQSNDIVSLTFDLIIEYLFIHLTNLEGEQTENDKNSVSLSFLIWFFFLQENNQHKTSKSRSHRFTFQSTVRQVERRRIADRLSREAEQKEAERLSELEAMRRVEEEFQRKRAREKASIRHQLRIYSMVGDDTPNNNIFPNDWQPSAVRHMHININYPIYKIYMSEALQKRRSTTVKCIFVHIPSFLIYGFSGTSRTGRCQFESHA